MDEPERKKAENLTRIMMIPRPPTSTRHIKYHRALEPVRSAGRGSA
jgi:hypothetical protein